SGVRGGSSGSGRVAPAPRDGGPARCLGAFSAMRSRAGLVAGLVLGLVTSAGAQAPVPEVQTTESRGLRIQWTVEPQTRDFNAVCGHIYNDQRVSARHVSLMVQSVANDRVVSRNIPHVAPEIPAQSPLHFFC